MRALALLLACAGLALVLLSPTQARLEATCTAAQKQKAKRALSAYRKAMPKQRAGYFRTHRSPGLRKAFVRKQQAKLAKLKRAAACTVRAPAPQPAPPPPAPPPAPPSPPVADTTPPGLQSAVVDGSRLVVRFGETVSLDDPAFVVRVNGVASPPSSAGADGMTVVLALAAPVAGDDVVTLDYGGGIRDAAGNVAPVAAGLVVANATPTPCSFTVSNGGIGGPGAQNEGATDLALHEPGVGRLRGVVLWIDFPDAPATESIPTLTARIFEPAAASYAAMSYGRLELAIEAAPRWYRLPQASAYYGLNAADGPGRKDEYIAAAIAAADAEVDFSRYDVVYLVPAAGAAAELAASTQRPRGSGLATVDGKELRHAVLVGSDRLVQPTHGSEQIVHETGHVLGLPDLYGDPDAVGGWDPMSSSTRPGAAFMGWHRWKLGWLEPSQLRCVWPGRTVEATLTPLEAPGGVKLLVVPIDATRALILENRQPLGLDGRLCDRGVLAYTVTGTVAFPGVPVRVLPARPDSDTDEAMRARCSRRYDAPLDLGPGETPALQDALSGARVELVAAGGTGYVVRVSR